MRLDVSKALVAEGREIPFAMEIALSEAALLGERVVFPEPARLWGFYVSMGERIHVFGEMDLVGFAHCFRCLAPKEQSLHARFDVMFALSASPDEPNLYLYDGAWIDLADMAADAALLSLPMQWLCGDACQGLCPVCGADRNHTLCSCRMDVDSKHPFSALQQLLTEDESEV